MKEKHGGNKIAMEAQIAALKALLKAKRAQLMRPVSTNVRSLTRYQWVLLLLLLVVAPLLTGVWWGNRIEVARIHVPVEGSGEPFRLAVLSDIHIGAGGYGMEHWRRAIALVEQQQPDAILLLGDYITSHVGIPALKEALSGIHAPLGVYAVLGNHDHWAGSKAIVRILEEQGIQTLTNRAVRLRQGNSELWLVGIDDLWSGKPDWQKAFRHVPRNAPVVLLSHNPDAALSPYRERANLIVSGHTHGGQMWLPLARVLARMLGVALIPHSEYGSRYPHGLRQEGRTWVYVTKGVTAGNRLPRWFNAREVVLIEIRPVTRRLSSAWLRPTR
ncbi:MAG: hypothetical protein KatS3mg022_2330 [Armatimonadota bacterium]|nr:MAG: hypothetical protein KatS3mg022_2330 [Armatimonadota bacterium]